MGMILEMVWLTPEQISTLQASSSLANDVAVVARHDYNERRHKGQLNRLPLEGGDQVEAQSQAMESEPSFREAREEMLKQGSV